MRRRSIGLAAALVAAGCYHGIDHRPGAGGDDDGRDTDASPDTETGDDGSSADDDLPPPPASCAGDDPPTAVAMARLSHHEYEGTLRELFGDADFEGFAEALPLVPADVGLARIDRLSQGIGLPHVTGYFGVAERVGEYYEANAEARGALVGCLGAGDDGGCMRDFAATFGQRAYRRPLTGEEIDELGALFDEAAADSVGAGVRQVLSAMLQAPDFVFHVELGEAEDDTGATQLTAYEIASRLSYYVWGRPPDDALLAAAESGDLDGDEGLAQERERLLADDRARAHFEHFADQWLGLFDVRSFEDAPAYRASGLALDGADEASRREVLDLVDHVVWTQGGSLADLMGTDLVVPRHEALAAVYGVSVANEPVPAPDQRRAGLLSRLGFAGSPEGKANPILRGRRVSRDLLCVDIPPPDQDEFPDGAFDPLPPDPTRSTREEVELTTSVAECIVCHASFNDFGFALEDHDGLGRYRTTESVFDEEGALLGEVPIDASATLPLGSDSTDVAGTAELSAALGESEAVRQCLSQRWFAYATAREPTSDDDCLVDWQAETLAEVDGMAGLIRLATARPQFRLKLPVPGE